MSDFKESDYMTTDRLLAITDGIFAIAMTLIVLTIGVPPISGPVSDVAIQKSLHDIAFPFFNFVLSFILLAMFWTANHKQLHYVKHVDSVFLWINIIWLLFIATVPLSTEISGSYHGYMTPQLIMNLNLLGIAFLLYLSWHYATKKGLISKKTTEAKIRSIKLTCLLFVGVALTATLLSLIIPEWSSIVYVALLLLERFV